MGIVFIFNFIDVRDLGQVARVSTRWKSVTEDPILWRYMGSRYYGDYLSKEDLKEGPKQKVISHYLSVIVNAKADLKEIERLVSHYQLDLYVPLFKKHIDLSIFDGLWWASSYKFLIVLGYQDAFFNRIIYLSSHKDWAVAAYESLVEKGNQKAIERKIEGLIRRHYHYPTQTIRTDSPEYTKDISEVRQLNELLVEKGDPKAIGRKICGLSQGGDVNPFYNGMDQPLKVILNDKVRHLSAM